MPIRVPPGRAGRLWLMRQLEIARRGTEVLDQKRRTLLHERRRTAAALAEATEDWERQARLALQSNDRALALAGERRLRLAAVHRGGPATVAVTWRSMIGTVIPTDVRVELDEAPDFVALGGATVALAADAHRRALTAAAAHAAARAAHEAFEAEFAATTRRLRAVERRWIPEHERALRRLELELAERELEDIARVRFARERSQSS